jgi:prepilin-type N-terminal cleavage/methylation domain-containing protein
VVNLKNRGFTLVELAIVLIIIGIILGAVLKGQDLINNAKAKRLLNDVKGMVTLQYTFYDRYRRFAGDGNNDGKIDYENLSATLNDFDNIPQNQFLTVNTPDIDAPFSELEAAQLLPVSNHKDLAKHIFNNIFYFSQVDGYNVLVIRQIPCFAAQMIDKDIDLTLDAQRGYIRESVGAVDSLGAVGDQSWSALCTTPNTLVDIVYFFDTRPN